jgi:muramoyltetrapeptide carboxypeptidase
MIKAQALRKGDTIGLITPASKPQVHAKIEKSVKYFESLGYRVTLGKSIEKQYGYLAGTDKERADDVHSMFRDKKVKAMFFLRGGYGTLRLLPQLDYDLIKRNPKIVVGYSDATSLHLAMYKMAGLSSCFFGPMPGVDIWNGFDSFAEECMWRALTSTKPLGELPMNETEGLPLIKTRRESVEGRLFGGNMTVFSSVIGTPYMPSLKNRIFLFEDVTEPPYRIDRYFAQLKAAGALDSAKAILLGQFSDCDEPDRTKPTLTTEEAIKEHLASLKVPILSNLPFGHVPRQWTVPMGAKVKVSGRKISVVESILG